MFQLRLTRWKKHGPLTHAHQIKSSSDISIKNIMPVWKMIWYINNLNTYNIKILAYNTGTLFYVHMFLVNSTPKNDFRATNIQPVNVQYWVA